MGTPEDEHERDDPAHDEPSEQHVDQGNPQNAGNSPAHGQDGWEEIEGDPEHHTDNSANQPKEGLQIRGDRCDDLHEGRF